MNNFVKLLITSLVAFSFACGGQLDDESAGQDDLRAPLTFDPFTSYGAAKAHAARYCKGEPQAVVLEGDLTSDGQAYQWHWTFRDGSYYVDVAVGAQSVRVTGRGLR